MHNVKLPEMQFVYYGTTQKLCHEEGFYLVRELGSTKFGISFKTTLDKFYPDMEYAGPIKFEATEPIPTPIQLDGYLIPEVHELGYCKRSVCRTLDHEGIPIVSSIHANKKIAILAHNAAIEIIQKHSK